MTNPERESETSGSVDRRTLLKGTAAAGMAGSVLTGTASAHPNTVVFRSTGEKQFVYRFRVTGKVERGDDTEENDRFLDDRTVEGRVGDKLTDSYSFSGEIADLRLEGSGKVVVNGNLVKDTTRKPSNEITIRSKGGKVNYRFRVSGRVETTRDSGAPTDKVISGSTVRGSVGSDVNGTDSVDRFRFTGAIAFDEADGPLTVKLDLNQPDP